MNLQLSYYVMYDILRLYTLFFEQFKRTKKTCSFMYSPENLAIGTLSNFSQQFEVFNVRLYTHRPFLLRTSRLAMGIVFMLKYIGYVWKDFIVGKKAFVFFATTDCELLFLSARWCFDL